MHEPFCVQREGAFSPQELSERVASFRCAALRSACDRPIGGGVKACFLVLRGGSATQTLRFWTGSCITRFLKRCLLKGNISTMEQPWQCGLPHSPRLAEPPHSVQSPSTTNGLSLLGCGKGSDNSGFCSAEGRSGFDFSFFSFEAFLVLASGPTAESEVVRSTAGCCKEDLFTFTGSTSGNRLRRLF